MLITCLEMAGWHTANLQKPIREKVSILSETFESHLKQNPCFW